MTAMEDTLTSGEPITTGSLLSLYSFEGAFGNLNRYAQLRGVARVIEPFLGDIYMEKSGNVHTISLNRLELFNIFRKLSEEQDEFYFMDYISNQELLAAVPVANYTLRIEEKDGAPFSTELVVNVKVQGDLYLEGDDSVEVHYSLATDPQKANVDYSISIDAPSSVVGAFQLHVDAVSAETDKTPRTAPPAGSKVVSSDEL
jgi:hypothetical protein